MRERERNVQARVRGASGLVVGVSPVRSGEAVEPGPRPLCRTERSTDGPKGREFLL